MQHVDDAENVEQLAACRSRAGLLAVSSNVKVPSRKVSDGDCLTLGEGKGGNKGWILPHILGLMPNVSETPGWRAGWTRLCWFMV